MAAERQIKYYKLFKNQIETFSSPVVDCRNFQIVQFTAEGHGTAACVIKAQVSLQKNPPNFSATATVLNKWAYAAIKDLDTGTIYAGATGYTFSSDIVKQFQVVTQGVAWFALALTGHTTGFLDADATIAGNV